MKKICKLLIGIIGICLYGCGNAQSNPIKSNDSCDLIYVTNGNNGDLFYVSDNDVQLRYGSSNDDEPYFVDVKLDLYEDIIRIVNNLQLNSVSIEDSAGWSYRITFIEGDEEIQSITFISNEVCSIDGKKYKIDKECCDDINKLFEEFRSIEITE